MNHYNLHPLKGSLYKALARLFSGFIIQESMLRTELAILNNTQSYTFDIYNQAAPISTEVRLDKNDSLFAFSAGLGIYQRTVAAQDQGKQPLQFYPNEVYFPAVAAAGGNPAFVPSDLETIYNGKLSVKRGNNLILESYPTRKFRKVGMTQQSGVANKTSGDAEEMLVPLTAPLQLPGQEQLVVNITFPVASAINWQAQAAGTENRLALVFDGFLVKGAKNAISDQKLFAAMGLIQMA